MNRSIGLIGLTFVAVSGVIGSGWLFAPLLSSQMAGPASIIARVIGGPAILFLALCLAEVSGTLPVAGGNAPITHFTHGDITSMALGWTAWVGYSTQAPIETIAMLKYVAGVGTLSYLGDFSGGLGLIPFGWDVAAAALLRVSVFYLASWCRLPGERTELYVNEYGLQPGGEASDGTPIQPCRSELAPTST